MDDKLKVAVEKFLNAFETVFDKDWAYTKEMLGIVDETEEQARNAKNAGLETFIQFRQMELF